MIPEAKSCRLFWKKENCCIGCLGNSFFQISMTSAHSVKRWESNFLFSGILSSTLLRAPFPTRHKSRWAILSFLWLGKAVHPFVASRLATVSWCIYWMYSTYYIPSTPISVVFYFRVKPPFHLKCEISQCSIGPLFPMFWSWGVWTCVDIPNTWVVFYPCDVGGDELMWAYSKGPEICSMFRTCGMYWV